MLLSCNLGDCCVPMERLRGEPVCPPGNPILTQPSAVGCVCIFGAKQNASPLKFSGVRRSTLHGSTLLTAKFAVACDRCNGRTRPAILAASRFPPGGSEVVQRQKISQSLSSARLLSVRFFDVRSSSQPIFIHTIPRFLLSVNWILLEKQFFAKCL